jgi:Zn-dependent peptidase ImmA (M78 family)
MALNPQILKWARETAGLSVDEAAVALKFKNAQGRTAAERLEAMESGLEEPSRSVLTNMARTYHRTLLVFYLSEPPQMGDRGQDFRRAPGNTAPEFDPTLDALIRDIRGRQGAVKDLLEQIEPGRLGYVGSAALDVPFGELARRIAAEIGFSLAEFRRRGTVQAAFGYLRDRVEASGAFVLLLGNLGSYHTDIPSSVFRGYAIADPVAPFIVVNDHDAQVAWPFTLLHEVAHLWVGATGISGDRNDSQIEAYCNSVAGEILLPASELRELRHLRHASLPEAVRVISEFARVRHLSRPMVAYKLLRSEIITHVRWLELDKNYADEWLAAQAKPAVKSQNDGGPSYYVLTRHRLGHALLELVKSSLSEGFLTHTRAGRILGVKPRNVDPLVFAPGLRGGQ